MAEYLHDRVCPPLSKSLIDYLESIVRPPVPRLDQTDRSIWVEVGKYQLLETLRQIYKRQQNPSDE